MDSFGTPVTTPSVNTNADASQYYGIVYIAMLTLCIIAWIIKEKCADNNDANAHPFHNQEMSKEEEEEMKAKKAIAQEIEYMSASDFQAYNGIWVIY